MNILQNLQPIWWLLSSALIGGALTWAFCSLINRNRTLTVLQHAETQLATRTAQLDDLRVQLGEVQQAHETLRHDFRLMESSKVAAETQLLDSQYHLKSQRTMLDEAKLTLSDTFRSLASEALAGNNQGFLALAEEKFKALKDETAIELDHRHTSLEALMRPLSESLRTYQQETKDLEDKRLREFSSVSEQLKYLATAQSTLQTETSKLVNALRSPHVRGRWGEIALRKTAELAGMSAYCDFHEQESVSTSTGRSRPDMVVKLPAGRDVVVDSKVPLNAFLDSLEANTDESRDMALKRHAGHVKTHVRQLASKEYWDQFPSAPEFVVLFIPNDSFLAAAAEQDPTLIESALTQKVVIATPTTFIALLRAIAYGWRQEQVAEGAQRISLLGQELAERMGTMTEHFAKVGHALGRAVESYNATVTSFENRILPSARKFQHLGVNPRKDVPDLQPVEQTPRDPSKIPQLADELPPQL
ncbi:MAG: DNA recombination protein RmuC [Nitrospirota bacterium]|nr:DNA recombination protein RmuC [Nitrospirota bacterium]MDH5586236.1 DNA recombination protein RmuC [Nitrospirota bacterium]